MATGRKILYVSPNKTKGYWQVKSSGEVISEHRLKTAAIDHAKSIAKTIVMAGGTAQIKVQKRDGKLQFEYTYPDMTRLRKG